MIERKREKEKGALAPKGSGFSDKVLGEERVFIFID